MDFPLFVRTVREVNAVAVKRAITTLVLANYFEPDPAYIPHAALLLRTWFLDPKTRMLPHLDYGQAIPGGVTGRKEGIIEWSDMTTLVLCLEILDRSKSPDWTKNDQKQMRAWLTDYYKWLNTSKIGIAEQKAGNNHGTLWDVQATAIALYLGKKDDAKRIAENFKTTRIAAQIEPDGRMPRELDRANGWNYSLLNLSAMCTMADYGRRVGVDLWHYKTADNRSIQAALDYVLPFADGTKPWPYYKDLTYKLDRQKLVSPLLRASRNLPGGNYQEHLKTLDIDTSRDRLLITP
jgi:hypothetical protein